MALHTRPKIQIALIPDPNWEETGETARWGNPERSYHVYREALPWAMRSKQGPMRDADGKPVVEVQANNKNRVVKTRVQTIPLMFYVDKKELEPVPEDEWGNLLVDESREYERNPDAHREFIHVDRGNGQDEKLFNFRVDPETRARQEQQAKRKAALDRLLDAAADGDIDIDALVAK